METHESVPTFFEDSLLFSASKIFQYSALHFTKQLPPDQGHGLVFK